MPMAGIAGIKNVARDLRACDGLAVGACELDAHNIRCPLCGGEGSVLKSICICSAVLSCSPLALAAAEEQNVPNCGLKLRL